MVQEWRSSDLDVRLLRRSGGGFFNTSDRLEAVVFGRFRGVFRVFGVGHIAVSQNLVIQSLIHPS